MDFKKRYSKVFLCLCGFALLAVGMLFAFKFAQDKKDANEAKRVGANVKIDYVVPISMALDDGYTYPTIVAMTSMLENKNQNAKYEYYIMHPAEFSQENKQKIKSLEKKYGGCEVNFINMAEKYKSARSDSRITTPTYYRLSLSELLPNLDKIIWLDGDTLTFSDLKEMYDINMEGYYYKGFLDNMVNGVENFTKENDHPICAGVMLINLKELRKDDMVNKFSKFIDENSERLIQHDQTTINALCYKKIGVLPPKFGIFNMYLNEEYVADYLKVLKSKDKYTESDMKEARENPVVLHCVIKPWKKPNCPYADKWWEYAKKTDFYTEIKNKYPVF